MIFGATSPSHTASESDGTHICFMVWSRPSDEDFKTPPTAELHGEAAAARVQSIQSQLKLGFTLCSTAEAEIRVAKFVEAQKVVNKLGHATQVICFHLNEPNYVPETELARLRKELLELDTRLDEIKRALQKP